MVPRQGRSVAYGWMMDAITRDTTDAAARWASTVSRRRYRSHRHELDTLVIDTVPEYADAVAAELQELEAAFARSTERYDAKHTGATWVVHGGPACR